jgi:hypothetical protein
MGKLADGNGNRQRSRIDGTAYHSLPTGVPRGTRETFRIPASYSDGTLSETDHRWYRTMFRASGILLRAT